MGGQWPRKASARNVFFTDSLSDLLGRYFNRVHRYKLALRDSQPTRGRREEEGGLMPIAWGCHIDVEQGIIRVGRKKICKGLEIFCLEWGNK